MSEYGFVKEINGKFYVLSWVVYYDYVVDMDLLKFESVKMVDDVLVIVVDVGILV